MVTSGYVDADPTKEFFVEMLVKDVDLIHAISDLVDNSVDGALRIRRTRPFGGLRVDITIRPDRFEIVDNCGGIPLDIARDYAFRFGRPAGAERVSHSVGRFGVGLKRAVFKLGRYFAVESVSKDTDFEVRVDVPSWLQEVGPWRFPLEVSRTSEEGEPTRELGTRIVVIRLHKPIADEFRLEDFRVRLRDFVQRSQQENLSAGLVIAINDVELVAAKAQVLQSPDLIPAARTGRYLNRRVRVRLIAGIGTSEPAAAGWYVFCNGRMVVDADRGSLTGWGDVEAVGIPRYHNQFARFRGYAYIDSEDAGLLPWTTTKNGLDEQSGLYRGVRRDMITLMRPVISFLNALDSELDTRPEGDRPLVGLVAGAELVNVHEVQFGRVFQFTVKRAQAPRRPMVTIQYSKPREQVAKVRESIGARSASDAGEKTFDFYYELECDD